MRRSVLAWITTAATLMGAAASSAGAEASAPSASIAVRMVSGQQVPGPDSGRVKADLVVTANADCRRGCDLVLRRYDQYHEVDQVLDTRTFAPGTTHRYTVRAEVQLAEDFGDSIRLVQHTATGPRDLTYTENHSLLVQEPDEGRYYATYDGDWRRELDLAATQTMVLRSRRAGSALTFRAGSGGTGQATAGIIAETGPSAGVLGVYADGVLVTKIDLRSAAVVKRKVVATLRLPGDGPILRLVNLTPPTRSGATVAFDGLLEMYTYGYAPRSGARRELWAPIQVRVLNQQFGTEVSNEKARMQVSATVAGCTPNCSLRYGEKVIASGSGGTQHLSGTITRSFRPGPPEPNSVTLHRGSQYLGFAYAAPSLLGLTAPTYSYGWPRCAWPGAMQGEAAVSTTPGTGWTTRWAMVDWGAQRTVAVISERGPGMGVMGVYQDGRLVKTVDLRSPTRRQRVVVASVGLGHDGRLTIANVTPPARADRTVLLEALIEIGYDED